MLHPALTLAGQREHRERMAALRKPRPLPRLVFSPPLAPGAYCLDCWAWV